MSPRRPCFRACIATWPSRDRPTNKREATATDGWGNLYAALPRASDDGGLAEEQVAALLTRPDLRIERIISHGQISTDWYDQEGDEWVLLVEGGARLLIEGDGEILLGPGDYLLIPAHVRHRVTWTDPAGRTIWLAIHFG